MRVVSLPVLLRGTPAGSARPVCTPHGPGGADGSSRPTCAGLPPGPGAFAPDPTPDRAPAAPARCPEPALGR